MLPPSLTIIVFLLSYSSNAFHPLPSFSNSQQTRSKTPKFRCSKDSPPDEITIQDILRLHEAVKSSTPENNANTYDNDTDNDVLNDVSNSQDDSKLEDSDEEDLDEFGIPKKIRSSADIYPMGTLEQLLNLHGNVKDEMELRWGA